MNDNLKVFRQDRTLATGVTRLCQAIFLSNLEESDFKDIRAKVIARQTDSKAVRVAFGPLTATEIAQVEKLFQVSRKQFMEIAQTTGLDVLVKDAQGLAGDPGAYMIPGMGETADQASRAARSQRGLYSKRAKGIRIAHYDHLVDRIAEDLKKAESLRQELQINQNFRQQHLISLIKGTKTEWTLTPRAFEVLRKLKVKNEAEKPYIASAQTYFAEWFGGLQLTPEEIFKIRDYFNLIDANSPSLIKIAEQPLLASGDRIISFYIDIVGLGGANAREVAEACIANKNKAYINSKQLVDDVLVRNRQGEKKATKSFEIFKKQIEALTELGNGFSVNWQITGDDGKFGFHPPPRRNTRGPQTEGLLLRLVAGIGLLPFPGGLRGILIDNANPLVPRIPAEEIPHLASLCDSLLKDLRAVLVKDMPDPKDIGIILEYRPNARATPGGFRIFVTSKGAFPKGLDSKILAAFEKLLEKLRPVPGAVAPPGTPYYQSRDLIKIEGGKAKFRGTRH